jgi:hypothetical protein
MISITFLLCPDFFEFQKPDQAGIWRWRASFLLARGSSDPLAADTPDFWSGPT